MTITVHTAGAVFDGARLLADHALVVEDGAVAALLPRGEVTDVALQDHGPGVLAPGFVDLQVNGGGGVMFNDAPTLETLRRIASAHARLGSTAILPTLITDTPERTAQAIAAAVQAVAEGVAGIAGLHLEGPHLSRARHGAHDPALIRPMVEEDVQLLLAAAARLPVLKVTLAPESVAPAQIARLAAAGVVVSLGHSDAGFAECMAAVAAGARCVTHLFNAMSQLGSREPGLVGAALAAGELSAGLIADAIHVHPATLALALRAKAGPGKLYLVTDAMATAGSDIDSFTLDGREVRRHDGRLTLADGTLAGADLEMARALQVMIEQAGAAPESALAMATAVPAQVIGAGDRLGHLAPGRTADFVLLGKGWELRGVWRAGMPVDRG
ncbi:N-acetylglucosamine-6-phosphate deacetylase [Meinhardsimonia xiamenensis]|jgi:N-acetylglucosamine-6-phosphate deacetylase|uniref:N-acetylglucosamine-6-phosphate deacetylase n=1 Tax=Meinhardsimonia xiamenensis TaxID=990712 RepID=A0A1G9H796_9RHOB|nr:N-acetylglucosamine-6-phosphate deacetylase [Meinhardsimonia xiamenensis]PRX29416.1 N-acetylglucosamine 6-phosphate deacetylase [Meinhardsimonia xiamenensis]SDL08654.1 N-acetylglucosamine-6-phosphate deacetylase [Meinhardsimonia xiamenensis]